MSALLATAWLAGVMGGVHCLAMCGAYVGAAAQPASGTQPLRPARDILHRQALLHTGRLASYVVLGMVAGAGGQAALGVDWLPAQRGVAAAANLMLGLLALGIATGRPAVMALEQPGVALYGALLPRVRSFVSRPTVSGRVALGALWGLTPCGLVYAVLPVAMFAGSAMEGGATMLAFGLGTLPHLVLAGALAAHVSRWTRNATVRLVIASAIAVFALAGLYRALFAPFPLFGGAFCLVP